MAFESLGFRYEFEIGDFPSRWLPLVHLYDPDLPLFPVYYFHVVDPQLQPNQRPADTDRLFGYIEFVVPINSSVVRVSTIVNKNLHDSANGHFVNALISEVRERFGLNDPVAYSDVINTFLPPHQLANQVLAEIWQRVVANAFGNKLPFGRLWDEVLGLSRFVASWYSSGRKGELIQTHYFASKLGERIQCSGGIPQVDFFLLPTVAELLDETNPLQGFPKYASLLRVAASFHNAHCSLVSVAGIQLSRFHNPSSGSLNTSKLLQILKGPAIAQRDQEAAIECFNAFDKGPQRTVIFLMMLDDLRNGRLRPSVLTSVQCGSIYDGLGATYQAPKTIQIYAQQSFGNPYAMPVDTWVESFLRWPLCVWPTGQTRTPRQHVFSVAQGLGKVERLIWVTAQARKVHSSACNDAVWCIKKASIGKARGANPLSCNVCIDSIRNVCPAYNLIRHNTVRFNGPGGFGVDFEVQTSGRNNVAPNQTFISCSGTSIYEPVVDDFSPIDYPTGFAPFPAPQHDGRDLTVEEFVRIY